MDCHLQRFVGVEEPCARAACPFWEAGSCGVERLAIGPDDPELVRYLLDLRARVESARDRGV